MTSPIIAKAQNEALVAADGYENIIDIVKDIKSKRFWESEMLTDWRAAAQEELNKCAAAIIFSQLDMDDLMSIAIGEVDINEL